MNTDLVAPCKMENQLSLSAKLSNTMLRKNILLFVFMGVIASVGGANSTANLNESQQEVCALVNAIDHDYEKVPENAWRRLSQAGINTIELGAYTKPFSTNLARIYGGLKFTTLASGANLTELRRNLDEIITQARQMKQKYIICYWPWLDGGDHITDNQCRESAAIMNELGERCLKAGFIFAFHNHQLEFRELNHRTVFDFLLEYTNPRFVSVELDVYHELKAKSDPVQFMKAHQKRIVILHLNTFDDKSAYPVVGDEMPEFDSILKTSREIGVRYLVVEGQNLRDPVRYFEESQKRMVLLLHNMESAK